MKIPSKILNGALWATAAAIPWFAGMCPALRADEYSPFRQFTCVPALNHFSERSLGIWNLSKGPYMSGLDVRPGADEALQSKYGIYSLKALQRKPYSCEIPATPLDQGWDNARPALHIRMRGDAVEINGHLFDEHPTYSFFSAEPDGVHDQLRIYTCAKDDPDALSTDREVKMTCRNRSFNLKTSRFVR